MAPKQHFITLNRPNHIFTPPEKLSELDTSFKSFQYRGIEGLLRPSKSGFFKAKTVNGNTTYIFVSPFPSIHSERSDHNWYRTQFDTDTVSNCGPSIISMAIGWAKGKYTPVSQIRNELGFNESILGATGLTELVNNAKKHEIDAKRIPQASLDQIDQYIRSDHILGVVYKTEGVTYNPNGKKDLVGRHFPDVVGHYTIIKGISQDKKYLIVNDPIPSNWYNNNFRHADGLSMLGQNRYYPASEFMKAIKAGRDMILFSREKSSTTVSPKLDLDDHWQNILSSVSTGRDNNAFYQLCTDESAPKPVQHTIKRLLKILEADSCQQGYKRAIYLAQLKIDKTDIRDLAPLAGFTSLVSLSIGGNHFSDLTSLGSLKKLKHLKIWGSQIDDITPLGQLQNLETIYFWGKHTQDILPLLKLRKLKKAEIWGENITSINSLVYLPKIKSIHNNGKTVPIPSYIHNLTY